VQSSPTPLLAAAGTLAVAAAACAGWFGWSWYSDGHSPALAGARARDVVLQDAEQSVLNFNTLDYRQASSGLHLWLASSTGALHSQLAQNLQQEVTLVQGKKTITTAKILDGAVTQLDTGARTASVMVAVDVTVTPAKGGPFTERESEVGQLTRTSSGWKLSSLGYPNASSSSAPGTSGTAPAPSPAASPAPAP
jgi:Mce-associated membrane protein